MEAQSQQTTTNLRVRDGGFATAWALLASALVVSVLGIVFNWYDLRYFDEAIHAFSFFALSLVAGLYFYGDVLTGYARHKILLVFTVFCLGLAFGVFWEWAEWGYDRLLTDGNTIHGKMDTMVDLAVDGVGAAVAGVALICLLRRA